MQSPLSLFELNQLIQQTLDDNLSPSYWIIAEIGELRDSAQGHAYLELVEKSGNQIIAKIRANIWAYTYRGISSRFTHLTGQVLQSGMKVLVQVSVQFHELYGLSLNVKDIDPNFTLGERAKRKQEVIDRLVKENLMQLNRQFILPKVPQRVAVISSSTAAGFGDFVNQVDNNPYGYRVHWTLYQATLQGDGAVESIIRAIQQVEEDQKTHPHDLLVIIRGGGAQVDMDCFDDFELAKTIANTLLPVVTGIGHERDESVADLVAHTKMKTPTAVAAFILSGFKDFEDMMDRHLTRIDRTAAQFLQIEERNLNNSVHLLKTLFHQHLSQEKEKTAKRSYQIASSARQMIRLKTNLLEHREADLKKTIQSHLGKASFKLEGLNKEIQRLDPYSLLSKGYTRSEINGCPVHLASPHIGDELITFTVNQKLKSKIESVDNYESKKNI